MKQFASSVLVIVSCMASPAYAVDFWHSNTVWAYEGMCSATFTFDSGMERIGQLKVSVSVIDNKSGKEVDSGVLSIEQFGESEADRYAVAYLEGKELCRDGKDSTIIVDKATAIINGKSVDLLKAKAITARNFIPFKIRLSK